MAVLLSFPSQGLVPVRGAVLACQGQKSAQVARFSPATRGEWG